jgi:hypothetical protein
MTEVPSDLTPLPTRPWDERPSELALDTEECRTALWLTKGNITKAAEMLKVSSARLRTFVKNSDYLSRECDEAKEVLKDIAESNVVEAMEDRTDAGRRDAMSRFVLASIGRDRGYGNAAKVTGNGLQGKFTISWEGEDTSGGASETQDGEGNVIDGSSSRVAAA